MLFFRGFSGGDVCANLRGEHVQPGWIWGSCAKLQVPLAQPCSRLPQALSSGGKREPALQPQVDPDEPPPAGSETGGGGIRRIRSIRNSAVFWLSTTTVAPHRSRSGAMFSLALGLLAAVGTKQAMASHVSVGAYAAKNSSADRQRCQNKSRKRCDNNHNPNNGNNKNNDDDDDDDNVAWQAQLWAIRR